MTLSQVFENYPSPIIAVDKNGFVVAKNYMATTTFSVLHIGALANKYTDIDFSQEKLSRCFFCGTEYTYFTLFSELDGKDITLVFISTTTFGSDLLPFDVLEVYKEKIATLVPQGADSKNLERQYIRAVHNNTVKTSFFTEFAYIFDAKLKKREKLFEKETVSLSNVCQAIEIMALNYLTNIDFKLDIDNLARKMTAKICETDIASMLLNALSFCIINSNDSITLKLREDFGVAQLCFVFNSNRPFENWMNRDDNGILNASLSLIIATEIAKQHNIEFSLIRNANKSVTENILEFKIPIKLSNEFVLSSNDTISEIVQQLSLTIFYGI